MFKKKKDWNVSGNSITESASYMVPHFATGVPQKVYDSITVAQRVNRAEDRVLISYAPEMHFLIRELVTLYRVGADVFDAKMQEASQLIETMEEDFNANTKR